MNEKNLGDADVPILRTYKIAIQEEDGMDWKERDEFLLQVKMTRRQFGAIMKKILEIVRDKSYLPKS